VIDVRLEPLTEAQLPEVEAMQDDAETIRFTRFPQPPAPGFVQAWYDRYVQGRLDGTKEAFAAVDGDGTFLALALAPHIDPEAAEMELGYVVAPAARGKGVASELLRQLSSWAFSERGAQRLTLLIDIENIGSQRVAERAGYQLEGVLRNSYFKQDLRSDTQLWSRLPTDPFPS
jgi:RimJ/RimL family protein N-acetyltransferase